MNHSPEPWHFDEKGHCIDDANHNMILDGTVIVRVRNDRRHESAKPEDLRRIVAAVNFCQHLPTELIEKLTAAGIGPATLAQWVRRNPEFTGELYTECIECGAEPDQHDKNCLLEKFLDILEGWSK